MPSTDGSDRPTPSFESAVSPWDIQKGSMFTALLKGYHLVLCKFCDQLAYVELLFHLLFHV